MSKDEDAVLLCVKVRDLTTPEPGSVMSVCQECEARIWVSRSGMAFVEKNPTVYICCTECGLDNPEFDPKRASVVPGAPRWMKRWFKKDRDDILHVLKVKDLDEGE